MASKPGAARCATRRFFAYARLLSCLAALPGALLGGWLGAAQAQELRPTAAVLIDRLCAERLRPNEEDRLFGLISLAVRTTIKYQDGVFDPDLIDDSMQDALAAITEACPQIAVMGDAYRLGRAVDLARDATINRMQDGKAKYSDRQMEKATAADLSEELSAQEIDAWLDALPARRRALALLLYASGPSQRAMAEAVGMQPDGLATGFRGAKTDLLRFFRADSDGTPAPPPSPGPAMQYRVGGTALAGLLKPEAAPPDAEPAARVRITGISRDVYAGWSLLATASGLPPEQSLDIGAPALLEPDAPGHRRMIVVAADEITDPHDAPRRFLLRAFAIDADKEGSGLGDSFHLAAAAIDNPQAQQTLHNPNLAAIEVARCLWHDYATGPDPGLCR
jgi:hypothetical protein